MDRKEAQKLLSALRPDGPEIADEVFAEALALADADPELGAWWEAQQEFDRKVSARLAEVPVPEELRAGIAAAGKIAPFRPRLHASTWLAAAALLALLCVAGTFWVVANLGPLDRADFVDQILPELEHDSPDLALTTTDRTMLRAWLKNQHAPLAQMPPKIDALTALGCQKFVVHGHAVTLICLELGGGAGVAHLFVIDKHALNDPPSETTPQFDNVQGWNVATWSDNKMSYLLATQASADSLKQLL